MDEVEEDASEEQRKRERVRNLLSSYYRSSGDAGSAFEQPEAGSIARSNTGASLDLDSSSFDAKAYVSHLMRNEHLDRLQSTYADLVHSIKVRIPNTY